MKRKTRNNPLAHLTPEEDAYWTTCFEYHANRGKNDLRADKLAWEETAERFPRLKKYIGAKP